MTYLRKRTISTLPALTLAMICLTASDIAQADFNPYIGEITAMGITGFCPRGWSSAEGQLLAVSSNEALFSLLGTTYGGDGRTTFALPDLRSRVPVGDGSGPGLTPLQLGQKGGQEQVTLTINQLAYHNHAVNANNLDGDKPGPGNKLLAAAPPGGTGAETVYSNQMSTVQMSSSMITPTGSNLPINVIDPTQVVRYCIALYGIYPSRN